MKPGFAKTSNVKRFLAKVGEIDDRAAPEACIVLGSGQAGYGKTGTGQWWANKNDAISLRLKAAATPHWILHDLVTELQESAPASSSEKLFNQAITYLAKKPRPIVLDEVENGLSNIKVLETVRDISDVVGNTIVFLGREYVWGKLKRLPQFKTRIAAHAIFAPITLDDVRLCCDELAEVEIADDLVKEIHRLSDGHIREVVKAIKNVERVGMRLGGKRVTADAMKGHPLVIDVQQPAPLAKAS